MKPLLLLTFLFVSIDLFAQYDLSQVDQPRSGVASQPFKKANFIILQTADSGLVAFKKILLLLQDGGEVIEKRDNELLSFSTEYRQITSVFIHQQSISGYVRGSTIYLNSKWRVSSGGNLHGGPFVSEYGTSNGNQSAKAFKIMDAVAKSYPGGKIFYVIK